MIYLAFDETAVDYAGKIDFAWKRWKYWLCVFSCMHGNQSVVAFGLDTNMFIESLQADEGVPVKIKNK